MGGNSTFAGHGQTGQSNSLVGEISVVVSEVLPNGNMRVRGEKLLHINRGNETIRVSGIVRPGDITSDNRVASTRVADAQIDYVGRLSTGKIFDQAKQAGMMVSGTVPGFAEALQHMQKGGTYRVWIPPQLAYGAQGAGDGVIPPNATLDFTITLLDIGRPAAPPPPQ